MSQQVRGESSEQQVQGNSSTTNSQSINSSIQSPNNHQSTIFTMTMEQIERMVLNEFIEKESQKIHTIGVLKTEIRQLFTEQEANWGLKKAECEYNPNEEFIPTDCFMAYKVCRFKVVTSFVQILKHSKQENLQAHVDWHNKLFQIWSIRDIKIWWYQFLLYWHDHKDEFNEADLRDLRYNLTYLRMAAKGFFFEPYLQDEFRNRVVDKV